MSDKAAVRDPALHVLQHALGLDDYGQGTVSERSPKPPRLTRSQQRYRDFLRADCGMTFGEWLRYERRAR